MPTPEKVSPKATTDAVRLEVPTPEDFDSLVSARYNVCVALLMSVWQLMRTMLCCAVRTHHDLPDCSQGEMKALAFAEKGGGGSKGRKVRRKVL